MFENLFQSIFTPPTINKITDYERLRNTKTFIQKRSQNIPNTRRHSALSIELMEKCRYKNYQQFFNHRNEWDALTRKIPLVYLASIKADFETIKYALRLDQQEYDHALSIPLFPEYAVVRLIGAVYSHHQIPTGTPEDEATEMIKQFSCKNGLRCCINYPDFKTIWIEPDGRIITSHYWPSLQITKEWAIFKEDGRDIGLSRLC